MQPAGLSGQSWEARCSVFVSRSTVRVEHLKPFPVGREKGARSPRAQKAHARVSQNA